MVGVLRKKFLSSTFQDEEIIENKEKIRAGPIDLGGPIKPHSSVMCHNNKNIIKDKNIIKALATFVHDCEIT